MLIKSRSLLRFQDFSLWWVSHCVTKNVSLWSLWTVFQLSKLKSKKTLLTLAKYSKDFSAFWNYKSMHLWKINWSNAQCSPFLDPGYGRSLIPTAVKSLIFCVTFCLINKSTAKFGFGRLWFQSQQQFHFPSLLFILSIPLLFYSSI